jgi:hypothetical protein
MQALTFLIALSSILIFEGGRRILASRRSRSGWGIVVGGLISLSLAAVMHIGETRAYKILTLPDEDLRFSAGAPWSNPKEALPNLPVAEQAEKTRILAVAYFISTGKLIEHLSADGRPMKLAPTEEEIKLREDRLALRAATQAHLSHTTDRPTHLLVVFLVVAGALFAFRAGRKQSAT